MIFFAALVVSASAQVIGMVVHSDYVPSTKVCIETQEDYDMMTIFHIRQVDPSNIKYSTRILTKEILARPIICNYASPMIIKHSIHKNRVDSQYVIGPRVINMTTSDSNKTISCKEMKVNICSGDVPNNVKEIKDCLQRRSSMMFVFGNSSNFHECNIQDNMMTICKTEDFDLQTNTSDMCYDLKSKWLWDIKPSEMMFTWYITWTDQKKYEHCDL